jgi:hypothetical protein
MRFDHPLTLASVVLLLAAAPAPEQPHSVVQRVPIAQAVAVLGRPVSDAEGRTIGRLIDVLVDADGKPAAAVIDFGGFLGVGSRKIAVQWSALHFAPADQKHPIVLELTPDQIKAAPEYSPSQEAAPVVTPTTPVPAHPPPSQAPPAPATASPPSAPEAPAAQDTQPQVSPQPTSTEPEAKPDPADKPAAR